jgi:sortase A
MTIETDERPAPAKPAGRTRANALPVWLRRRPSAKSRRARTTPREVRWWIGVVWLALSALLLGLVGHMTLFGALQHARSQEVGYAQLRASLAEATTPLGQLDLNEKLVAAGTPVALLQIPKLGLTEVVREGTASSQTRQGVGHRPDTVMPGQAGSSVLYGRQTTFGGPFGGLAKLVPGDTITVTTGQGKQTFTVFGLRRPGDPLPASLADGKGRLELVTADGVALAPASVLYVDAALKGSAKDTPAQVFLPKAVSNSQDVMQSDSTGLLPLMFSFQWLVLAAILSRWLTVAWGRWQAWIVSVPVLLVLGASTADAAAALLPNLT